MSEVVQLYGDFEIFKILSNRYFGQNWQSEKGNSNQKIDIKQVRKSSTLVEVCISGTPTPVHFFHLGFVKKIQYLFLITEFIATRSGLKQFEMLCFMGSTNYHFCDISHVKEGLIVLQKMVKNMPEMLTSSSVTCNATLNYNCAVFLLFSQTLSNITEKCIALIYVMRLGSLMQECIQSSIAHIDQFFIIWGLFSPF